MVFSSRYRLHAKWSAYSCEKVGRELWLVVRYGFCWCAKVCYPALQKIVGTVVTVVFLIGVTLASLENRPVITMMYWLPIFMFRTGRGMSMAMSSRRSIARKTVRLVFIILSTGYGRTLCSPWRVRIPCLPCAASSTLCTLRRTYTYLRVYLPRSSSGISEGPPDGRWLGCIS